MGVVMKSKLLILILVLASLNISAAAAPKEDLSPKDRNLIQAIKDDNVKKAEDAIKNGANINARFNGLSLLDIAARYGSLDVAHLLVEKKGIIKKMSHEDIEYNKNGRFTPKSVARFLEKYSKALDISDFKDASKIKVKRLESAEKSAPWGALQILKIDTPKQNYILKEMKKKAGDKYFKEIDQLAMASKSGALKDYTYPSKNKKYPQFVFPVGYLMYEDKDGKEHALSIMPIAPGNSFVNLIKDLKTDPNNDKVAQRLAQAYFDLGRAMAKFYRKFMADKQLYGKTLTHGDLHIGNLFYDYKNREIAVIDNESISERLNKSKDPVEDLAVLLMKSLFVLQWTEYDFFNGWHVEKLYRTYLPSFISGFLSSYNQKDRKEIFEKVVYALIDYKDPLTGNNWYTDKTIIKHFSHKDMMEPIFNELRKSDIFFRIDPKSVKEKNDDGKTLLHEAAINDDSLSIWPILAAGADVNAHDPHQNTPLHDAAYFNHPKIIRKLIVAGADLNAKDQKGATPLNKAEYSGSKDAVEALTNFGAK